MLSFSVLYCNVMNNEAVSAVKFVFLPAVVLICIVQKSLNLIRRKWHYCKITFLNEVFSRLSDILNFSPKGAVKPLLNLEKC